MKTDEPVKLYLKDYTAPDFGIEKTELFFDIEDDFCRVESRLLIFKTGPHSERLFLDGEGLTPEYVRINGHPLKASEYTLTDEGLSLTAPNTEKFTVEIGLQLQPQLNTSLEGLYKSDGMFCTQCEAQSFRKITYFLDRPDVMSLFTVQITADKNRYPILLSNGDLIEEKDLPNKRHQVRYQDPHKKPCYLFALVAGDLGCIKDSFTTQSGRNVQLAIYASHGHQERCVHAMDSLKKSMRWDEVRFGREYDLGTYVIVAAENFNAGAMENKGLNIFNSKLILADPSSATDDDYANIESVIAHEYFHNWTGNRITLRDWFHLSLKEGLTVFRDQEFSADMNSRSEIRIQAVDVLRQKQFPEDAGPNSHPIRPDSCYAVDNFFTPTIYEKGSEVIRMMQTLVGRPGFRKGMDLYFERHDGQAVVIEDFAGCISEANGQTWDQFKLWYSQAGTPVVKVQEEFDPLKKEYHLQLSQSCPPTAAQPRKQAFHIPLVTALISREGQEMPLNCQDQNITKNSEGQTLLHLRNEKQNFRFTDLAERPVLSINRQFSAPIRLDWNAKPEDLLHLLAHDTDEFNRWECGQKLALDQLLKLQKDPQISEGLVDAFSKVLSSDMAPGIKALIVTLPNDAVVVQSMGEFSGPVLHMARKILRLQMAQSLQKQWQEIYHLYNDKNVFERDSVAFGKRHLKNIAMGMLALLPGGDELAFQQFSKAQIMTDQIAALAALCQLLPAHPLRQKALDMFYQQWKQDTLTMHKWFQVQASAKHAETFLEVQKLSNHPDFNLKNPNRVYALYRAFGDNLVGFHDPAFETYEFMATKIAQIDALNPAVAARLASHFGLWRKLTGSSRIKAEAALDTLLRGPLSKLSFEILSKTRAEN